MLTDRESTISRQPDFIGIGFRRCASSWLHACLSEHFDIGKPRNGIHFFSDENNYKKGKEWYEKQLGRFYSKKVVGEYSISYAFPKISKKVADRIHKHYPNIKIFGIVRNPIDRIYSDYLRSTRLLELDKKISFEKAIEQDPEFVDRGFYGKILRDYYRNYKESQMLVLFYEDMKSDKHVFFHHLFDFLGVDSEFLPSKHIDKKGAGYEPISYKYQKAITVAQKSISAKFRSRGLGLILDGIKKIGINDFFINLNIKKKQQISNKTRAMLYEIYKKDIDLLSSLVKRDLSFWR